MITDTVEDRVIAMRADISPFSGFKSGALFCHQGRLEGGSNSYFRRSRSIVSETASRY